MANRSLSLAAGKVVKITPALNASGQVWFTQVGKQDAAGSTFSNETPLLLGPYCGDITFNITYTGDITVDEVAKGLQVPEPSSQVTGTIIKTITGSTYTVLNDDNGKMLAFAAACTVTIGAKLRKDFSCGWSQESSGAVTFAAASGATIQSKAGALASAAQYSVGGIFGWAANVFRVTGV